MLITDVSLDGTERTWRRPLATRLAVAVCVAVFPVLPGLWLALTLVTNGVPGGGWLALGLAVAAWGILAWRALVHSVTLTRDTLVIRNITSTVRVPLATVTEVGFRRGQLTVSVAHGPAARQRLKVSVAGLGSAYYSGRRIDADAVADAITDATGLPRLPPRREIISRKWSWGMLVAAAACLGSGICYGPLTNSQGHRPFALLAAGGMLYSVGIGTLGLAVRLTRDHRRKRAQQAAAGEWGRDAA